MVAPKGLQEPALSGENSVTRRFPIGTSQGAGLHQSGHSDSVKQETLSPGVLETGEKAVFHLVFSPVYPKVWTKESGKGRFAIFFHNHGTSISIVIKKKMKEASGGFTNATVFGGT